MRRGGKSYNGINCVPCHGVGRGKGYSFMSLTGPEEIQCLIDHIVHVVHQRQPYCTCCIYMYIDTWNMIVEGHGAVVNEHNKVNGQTHGYRNRYTEGNVLSYPPSANTKK